MKTDKNRIILKSITEIDHIKTYPEVRKRIEARTLSIHAWRFDIAKVDVYAHDNESNSFILIDEVNSEKLLKRFEKA